MKKIMGWASGVPLAMVLLWPLLAAGKESVCDGLDRAARGICVAYCEGLDCDGGEGGPNDSPVACERLWTRFEKVAGPGAVFPCEVAGASEPDCPCWEMADEIFEFVGDPLLCDVQAADLLILQGTEGIIQVSRTSGSDGPYLCQVQDQEPVVGIQEPEAMDCMEDLMRLSGGICGAN